MTLDSLRRHPGAVEDRRQAPASEQPSAVSIKENESPDKSGSVPQKRPKIFGKLPHAVADDRRLGLKGFFVVCYRARQRRNWSLRVRTLHRYGMGEDAAYAGINEAKSAGYLRRSQRRKKTSVGYEYWFAEDRLDLSAAPPDGRPGYQLLRNDLDVLTWKQIALRDFIWSYPPGFVLPVKKIAKRFSVSRKTIQRLVRPLVKGGFIVKDSIRERGRYRMHGYSAPPGQRKAGNKPRAIDSGTKSEAQTPGATKRRSDKTGAHSSLLEKGIKPYHLKSYLGPASSTQEESRRADAAKPVSQDKALSEQTNTLTDADIRRQLREVAKGRIKPQLLERRGLQAFRRLMSRIMDYQDVTEADAFGTILAEIATAFRSNGCRWLNSWTYLERRLPTGPDNLVDETARAWPRYFVPRTEIMFWLVDCSRPADWMDCANSSPRTARIVSARRWPTSSSVRRPQPTLNLDLS